MAVVALRPRAVAATLDELLAGASSREPFAHDDGKSAVPMERVAIGDERFVVKHLHVDGDWIARGYGDLGCKPVVVWESGLLDVLPDCIDPAVLGAARGLGRNGWGAALLMRDVGEWLVPVGDDPIPLEQHLRFLGHMAGLHAQFSGFADESGQLTPYAHRWMIMGPEMLAVEQHEAVPRIAAEGWERFSERAPADVLRTVAGLRCDVDPLVRALRATPSTLVHGDWKLGNLGSGPDGRTILLDWQSPGEGPAASDLCWYLALNAARLPQSKEDAIAAYRRSLEAWGVDATVWWDCQLDLCLLGTLVQFGWEKALGSDAELGWWCEGARAGIARL